MQPKHISFQAKQQRSAIFMDVFELKVKHTRKKENHNLSHPAPQIRTTTQSKFPPGTAQRQTSFWMYDPLAGVVIELFGSDSHVTAPLYLRMYLYSPVVDAGSETVMLQIG